MSTTDAFAIKHYTILTSFSNRTIYMKLTDTIGFVQYEAYLDGSDFHIALPIESVYQLITNCFAEDTGYNVKISVSGKTMTIRFHAQINGFIMFDFPVYIKEKLITTDGQLTLSFNRMEERQNRIESKMETLVEDVNVSLKTAVDDSRKMCEDTLADIDLRCNNVQDIVELKHANIETSINKWCADVQTAVNSRCTETISHLENTLVELEARIKKLESLIVNSEIDIRMNTTFVSLNATSITTPADNYLKFDKLCLFENLQQLHFIPITLADLSKCHFPHLKELYLDGGGKTHFRSLLGISGMPDLEHISIINAPGLNALNTILPHNHKIKSIHVKDCPGINIDGLSIYCRVNHIQLVKT